MSTKIYNGYKLSNMDVKELNEFVLKFCSEVKEVTGKSAARFVANSFTGIIDDLYLLNDEDFIKRRIKSIPTESNDLSEYDSIRLIREIISQGQSRYQEMQRTKFSDPCVDYDCEICLIPLEDKILVLLFTEQKEITALWETYEEVSFYGYWNNVDPDENCTEEEWEQRRKDWNIALPGIGIPSENGMTIKISEGFPSLGKINREDIIGQLPSFESRVHNISEEILLEKIFERVKKEVTDSSLSDYRIFLNARKELKSEENQKKLLSIKKDIEKKLVREIEEEDLKISFSELRDWTKEKTKGS